MHGGNMVLQEYYKHFIDTRDAQCKKPTVIRHITENMKCDAANNKKIDSFLPYIHGVPGGRDKTSGGCSLG